MSYVLVTGCNGFIGSRITNELLKSGYKVIGLSTGRNSVETNGDFKYIKLDLTDSISVKKVFTQYKISKVIHLAAIAHLKGRKRIGWNEFYRVNTLASKTIFHCAIESGASIFYARTVDIYGSKMESLITEETEPNPISNYAKSKYYAEKILNELTVKTRSNYVIARFAPVYSNSFMKDIYKRIYIKYPQIAYIIDGGYDYQFVSINNICDFVLNWVQHDESITGVYNICDNELINTRNFIKLEKNIGSAKLVIPVPSNIFRSVQLILKIASKILKSNKINKINKNMYKLIKPPRYSVEKMEAKMTHKWN